MFSFFLMKVFFSVTNLFVKKIYLKKMFNLFIIFFSLSAQAVIWSNTTQNVTSKKDAGSASLSTSKELHVIYYDYFPWHDSYRYTGHKGCIRLEKNTGRAGTTVLKCMEHLKLLVATQTAREWLSMQQRRGYFSLTINSLNVHKARARVLTAQFSGFNPDSMQRGVVTGISSRHVTDVRKYFIKNRHTQTVAAITVTPEHLFYVVNKHAFIPIKDISADDVFITRDGYHADLVCDAGGGNHCGIPWHNGEVVRVYNLEVNQGHQYFAGRDGLLVHNVCNLARSLQADLPGDLIVTRGRLWKKRAYLNIVGLPQVPQVEAALKKIKPTYTGEELNCFLLAAAFTGKPLKIKRLAGYFDAVDKFASTGSASLLVDKFKEELSLSFGTNLSVRAATLNDIHAATDFLAEHKPVLVLSYKSMRIVTEDYMTHESLVSTWNKADSMPLKWVLLNSDWLRDKFYKGDWIRYVIALRPESSR